MSIAVSFTSSAEFALRSAESNRRILEPILVKVTPVSLLQRLRRAPKTDDWNTLIELCTPLLLKWAKSAQLSDAAAADLVQDVFVVLIQEMPRFEYDPNRSFRGWLKTVTLNKWRSGARKLQPKSLDSQESLADSLTASEPEQSFWEAEFTRALVAQAMEIIRCRFEPQTWEACKRMTIEGQSAQQAADALGISVAAAYKSKSRVLKVLREELEGFLD